MTKKKKKCKKSKKIVLRTRSWCERGYINWKKLFDCSCICAEEVYLNCIECYLTSEKQRNVIVKNRNFKLVLKKQSTKEEAQGFE